MSEKGRITGQGKGIGLVQGGLGLLLLGLVIAIWVCLWLAPLP
jgi:hypothetical protein